MSRPRLDNSLTRDNVLSRMVAGKTYTASALAAKFHVPTVRIRPLIEQLMSDGDIETAPAPEKQIGFVRSTSRAAIETAPVVQPSVATPPIHIRLDGAELKGYDSEIRTRMALCMMVRGR